MLFIDKTSQRIIRAKEAHLQSLTCFLRKKVLGSKCTSDCKICKPNYKKLVNVPLEFILLICDNFFLNEVIVGEPDDLFAMTELVWHELIKNFSWQEYDAFLKVKRINEDKRNEDQKALFIKYNETYELLLKVFDYDDWFQNKSDAKRYDAYQLAENLDRNTCTYCNRLYTSTMKTRREKKVMRPTFDHWYSHGKHPLLALSFYNLIPSCNICNSSVKGFADYLTTSHLHPYVDKDCTEQFSYSYDYFKSTNQLSIKIVPHIKTPKIFNTYNDLKLREMYDAHHSELRDLINIKEAYSTSYIENMKRAYQNSGLSNKEIYRLAFGTELDINAFHRRPLSKFKRDILKELKMLEFLDR